MPTEAALNPVASATKPLKIIARSSPLPALSAVAPSAANKPVPMIMAAVRNVAEVLPRARRSAGPDRTPFRSLAIRQFPFVKRLVLGGRRRFCLAGFAQRGLEAGREFLG